MTREKCEKQNYKPFTKARKRDWDSLMVIQRNSYA